MLTHINEVDVKKWISHRLKRNSKYFESATSLLCKYIVGQLRPSIVRKMLKLWDFALDLTKA